MTPARFNAIARRYKNLRIAVVGDFCLDRYLEIDADKPEISIETGLAVHNIINVRSQPGGSGTILNNLAALGIGTLYPVGFAGEDGEGYELMRALVQRPGVKLDHFFQTPLRHTFTYTKPMLGQFAGPKRKPAAPLKELNRLDIKNWSATPAKVSAHLNASLSRLAKEVDAFILLSQVDIPGTGVLTKAVQKHVAQLTKKRPSLFVIADSRTGLQGFPSFCFKMNAAELQRSVKQDRTMEVAEVQQQAAKFAKRHRQPMFITLAERGVVGATAAGEVAHAPTQPLRGEIDIVGAGDSVTANVTAAQLGGATLHETLEIAMAGASVVIHQLGTTGTASVPQIRQVLAANA